MELLIYKQTQTYRYEFGERKIERSIDYAKQNIKDEMVKINTLKFDSQNNNNNIEQKKVWNFIDDIVEKVTDNRYQCELTIEKICIKKQYLYYEACQQIYYTVVYNLQKKSGIIASEFMVFSKLDQFAKDKVLKKIIDDKKWDKLEKKEQKTEHFIWIFSSQAAGYFFHECIGHLLEQEQFRISNFNLGDRLLDSDIKLYENWEVNEMYDDVGNRIKKNLCILDKGIIRNILTTDQASGNAWTQEPYIEPMARMHSMYLTGGLENENIGKDVSDALYIKEVGVGEYNPINGEVGLSINKSYSIEEGKIKDALMPFTLLFNMHDLIKGKMIASNNYEEMLGLCGKNGAVKVVKYRIPEILIDWRENGKFIADRYL